MVKPRRSGEKGALEIAMLLGFLALSITGFGFWGLLRHWRFEVETQLRLDRCVGEAALELRQTLEAIENANSAIRATRLALAGAVALAPQAVQLLRAGLRLETGRQELWLAKWKAKEAAWLVRKGCGKNGDLAPPLPWLAYRRDPPDLLGPLPLTWPERPSEFQVKAFHFPRRAAARVRARKGETGGFGKRRKWTAEWAGFS